MRWKPFLLAPVVTTLGCSAPASPSLDAPATPNLFSSVQSGKRIGLFAWPRKHWGHQPFSGGVILSTPKHAGNVLQQAKRINYPLFLGIPRTMLRDGSGHFSLSRAKSAVDKYAAGPLKPDSVRKYGKWLTGWYLIDEPFCARCWGGRAASKTDLIAFAKYFRKRIDPKHLVPMAIRASPSKLATYGDWGTSIDVAWAVWNRKNKRSAGSFIDYESTIAKRHGWKLVGAVNVEDCSGTGTAACTASQLRSYLKPIIRHSGVCASINWKWASARWDQTAIRDAWSDLARIARNQPTQSCR